MEYFFLCKGDLSTESGNADPIPCIHFFICGYYVIFAKINEICSGVCDFKLL
jgi:hypothetical protein